MVFMLIAAVTGVQADNYITEVISLGAENGHGSSVIKEYRNKGWTVVDNDLNRNAGGWDVYIAYKTSSTANPATDYITDICASEKNVSSFTFDGRTYYRSPTNSGFNGDLNRGAGGAFIYIYYTRDRVKLTSFGDTKRVITKLSVTNVGEDNDQSTGAISWRNSQYSGLCDVNRSAGGDYIYIQQHFTTQTLEWKEEPTFASGLVFNGTVQNLVRKTAAERNWGTLKFRVNNGPWTTDKPQGQNVGTYKVDYVLDGAHFANNSTTKSATVTIDAPTVKAKDLTGVFNQAEKKVHLNWSVGSIPGNYTDYYWVVYRDGVKIAKLNHDVFTYADGGYTNETSPVYDIYYVSKFWDENTTSDDTKTTVTVSTVRTVPVNNVEVECQADRIIFAWTSDGYATGFGNKFRIYVGDDEAPVYTLTPTDMQTTFRWEHRTTDQHSNRQNKVDEETGVPYTEEPLNACNPSTYRIEGVIGDKVLNSYDINPKAIGNGTLFYNLDATKGVYEGMVKLSWHVNKQGSTLTKTYIVERRQAEQENEAWTMLARMSNTDDYLTYDDQTALPGVFYDYRVTVEDKCSDGTIINNEITNIGYAKSTGTVTGRIAYGSTGTAVQGVEVVMTMISSGDDNLEQYHSMYFTDVNGSVVWRYPSDTYAPDVFSSGDFTVQMWLFPEAFSDSRIVDFGNDIALGMTSSGQLTFTNGTSTQTFDGITLKAKVYNHVVLTRSGTTLTCYVGKMENGRWMMEDGRCVTDHGEWMMDGATQFELGHFKGSVDEFRLWTKCLSEDDILENYDHLLVGNEKNLETYWTFDEGLRTQFFDYSRNGTTYHQHHGSVGSNAMVSTVTPSMLTLKSKTDDNGNYVIQGIPFSGEGTTYAVVPMYGIHEFNPNKTLLFFNSNSLVHNNTDFEDVSSFMMSGHIYYAGTNVPADSVQLYVDGMLQSKNGETVQTDENGYYELSVPIGKHFVEAKLSGHTMTDGGRYPTQGTFYFDRPVQHDFSDATLVNLIGRVGGGVRNDTLAVGFAASKNNIGIATIQLALNNESFSLNCLDDHISDAATKRIWASDTTSINSSAWTGTNYDAKYIFIRTDSLTGEFSALLPPLKYKVKSLRVDNNPEIEFLSLPEISLTNAMQEYTDKILPEDRAANLVIGSDSYKYNTKQIFTYFAPPQIDVTDKANGTTGAFGEQELIDYPIGDIDSPQTLTISDIWKQDQDGTINYMLGYPLYKKGKTVTYEIFGYEKYTNYDGKEPVNDLIPLNEQEITLSNEMGEEQKVIYHVDDPSTGYQVSQIYDMETNKVTLDANGHVTYKWGVGLPNIIAPYSRNFSIILERNNRTYDPFSLNAVVLGDLPEGDNFVTQGPDLVQFVLRDPPGAKSTTTLKRAVVNGTTDFSSDYAVGNHQLVCQNLFGASVTEGLGVGFMHIQQNYVYDQLDVGTHATWRTGDSDDKAWTTTYNQAISTSPAFPYIGSAGDVFVGTATNILLGKTRNLCIVKNNDGKFEFRVVDALSLGQEVKTLFNYTAYELENVMIPKWKDQRLSYLIEVPDSITALNYENTGKKTIYVTWVGKNKDTDYELNVNYFSIPPLEVLENEMDSVQWCTNQIKSWEKVLSDNEENKVKAMQSREANKGEPWNGWENFSIDGGSTYTYSVNQDTTKVHKDETTWYMGGILNNTWANSIKNFIHWGVVTKLSNEAGREQSDIDGVIHKNSMEWDYVISDGNPDTDLSIDKYPSNQAGYSDVFSLFGGQTYNPYEGKEYTKWFEPGKHVLSNGSEQMEQPDIRISTDGVNSAKEATLTDVPAGQSGQFTLFMSNKSNANRHYDPIFQIVLPDAFNQKGLNVQMDGLPLSSGHNILIPQGETVKKVIIVTQTDQSVLDYDSVSIVLASRFQPIEISDKVLLHTHFKPASSPIDLVVSEPVFNIETMQRTNGNLEMKLTNFNRQFKGMKKLGVEYRYEGSTSWTQPSELQFLVNKEDSTKQGDQVLPTTGDLYLSYNMSDTNYYPQGTYTFRAYTTTMYGEEPVTVYSKEIAVVKDDVAPHQLTTPSPSNGILGYGDDMMVEFNEDIVPGYVSDKNIIVTAKLNNQPVQHDVALQLLPYGQNNRTINPVFLQGDFSIECWFKYQQDGVILRQGQGEGLIRLSVKNDGKVTVSFGKTTFISEVSIPKNTWIFLALSYDNNDMTFSMLAEYETTSVMLFTNQNVGFSPDSFSNFADDKYIYLGCGVTGAIHDLAIYDIYREASEASASKYQTKNNYVYGLTNYWPMNEGHGTIAADSRHTHNFEVNNRWEINNVNYSLDLTEKGGVAADISRINTSQGDSYAIELWNMSFQQAGTLFETGTTPGNTLRLRYDNSMNLWLDYGEKSHMVVSCDDFPNYAEWHHLALNVVRGQAASFYYNGLRTAVIAEVDLPPLQGAQMKIGENIRGRIDELRIWNAALTESRLLSNMYNCIDTTDIYSRGLVAYYPLEKAGVVDGVNTKVATLENMSPGQQISVISSLLSADSLQPSDLTTFAPPLKAAPVESRLMARPIASERKVVINLVESSGIKARDIEGTTLNITIDEIHDMHGNTSAPIRWMAYVQRNALKWTKDSVTIIKQYGNDLFFDVDIVNKGGNTEYYTLYNMPQWLTLVDALDGSPVENTGDLAPQSKKTLRFKVMPMVAVGNYDVTVGLQGNDEILEPLRIVMKVRGEAPNWTVNPDLYENSMSIVAQVYINGVLLSNSESRVAAFIDGECRGVAEIQPIRGSAFVALSVYGTAQQNVKNVMQNLDNGKSVTFRIWDAARGVTYTNVNVNVPTELVVGSPASIAFDPSMTYGNFDMPVIFSKSNLMEQELKLKQNWNWISLNVEPVDTKTSIVFKDVSTWDVYIKDRTTGTYFCNGTNWEGKLTDMHANTMYKMKLTKMLKSKDLPALLPVTGEQVKLSDTKVTLKKNWNWISYLPTTTMTLDMALAGANPKRGDQVKSLQGFAIYGTNGWDGNLKVMESGKGYLYYSVDDATKEFVYPTPNGSTSGNRQLNKATIPTESSAGASTEPSLFTPVEPENYSDNMSMVIKLVKGDEPVTDAELGAFIDEECRGTAVASETSGLYYLLIAGEGHGKDMQICAAIDGTVTTICTSVPFNSDAIIGTPWEPFIIDLDDPSGINTLPEDLIADTEWYTLQGFKIGRRPTTPGVYIHRGKKVIIRQKKHQ